MWVNLSPEKKNRAIRPYGILHGVDGPKPKCARLDSGSCPYSNVSWWDKRNNSSSWCPNRDPGSGEDPLGPIEHERKTRSNGLHLAEDPIIGLFPLAPFAQRRPTHFRALWGRRINQWSGHAHPLDCEWSATVKKRSLNIQSKIRDMIKRPRHFREGKAARILLL